MIETALVYIYSFTPGERFVGCGALIEGDWVATCRHVGRMANTKNAESGAGPTKIEIEFPYAEVTSGAPFRSRVVRADECSKTKGKPPDLVLLEPESVPEAIARLRPATHERFETGPGYARVGLIGRDKTDLRAVIERRVSGQIDTAKDGRGFRQFVGDNLAAYWSDRGASGSPVFVETGEQLAGILALSEIGVNEGKSPLHEAAIVPGTTIRLHLERAEFDRSASRLDVKAEDSQRVRDPGIAGRSSRWYAKIPRARLPRRSRACHRANTTFQSRSGHRRRDRRGPPQDGAAGYCRRDGTARCENR